jgi:hypothetical protein
MFILYVERFSQRYNLSRKSKGVRLFECFSETFVRFCTTFGFSTVEEFVKVKNNVKRLEVSDQHGKF